MVDKEHLVMEPSHNKEHLVPAPPSTTTPDNPPHASRRCALLPPPVAGCQAQTEVVCALLPPPVAGCQAQTEVVCASLLSVVVSLAVLLPAITLLVDSQAWLRLAQPLEEWLERHPWDRKVGE